MLLHFARMLTGRATRKVLGTALGGFMLLVPVPSAAADWFSDDFETGTLRSSDSPPGRWDETPISSPNSLASDATAAHRGLYGLLLTDRSSTTAFQASADVARPPLTSSFFFRTWLRLRSVSTSGDVVLVQALPAQVELRIARQDPVWELAVRNGSGRQYVSRRTPTTEPVREDRWYLVEFGARGLGSPAGQAWLWLDGVEVASLSGIDWQDADYQLEQLRVGEPWTDTGRFVGSIDVDDVRVSATPMASHLELRLSEEAKSGCIAVEVSLRASSGDALAPAPYEVPVTLGVSAGSGSFHTDTGCKDSVESVRLPAGTPERRVYFRPNGASGKAMLRASHPDFLPATLTVDGTGGPGETPDGDEAAGPWTTDLGCSATGGFAMLPMLLGPWVLWRRQRPLRTTKRR
jgi:hypothetical protein